jgi:glycosyltransferase involved in cell wall biosynthesis
MTPAPGPIGFLVKTYPKLSETFILGEILGLERQGMALRIFALQRPTDEVFHGATREVRASVRYLDAPRWRELPAVVFAHLATLAASPRRYLAALAFARARGEAGWPREFVQAGRLAYELPRAGIGHLHAHFAAEPASLAELVQRLSGISYSISAHAKDIYRSPPGALERKLRGAAFTVTCTECNREYLARIAGTGARVYRAYHGVDLEKFSPRAPAVDPSVPLVLSVGRLREKKGFATLIEACGRLADAGVAFRCEIVGYGPERDRLQALIDSKGLSGTVALVGKLTHEQVVEKYRAATVFVLPCQIAADGDRDGIPNVLLEAMAMRLPVVSTAVSGIPEAIEHGTNGLLVDPENASALAQAVRRLLLSPILRSTLGARGRITVLRRFSNESNLGLIRELLSAAALRACQAAGA